MEIGKLVQQRTGYKAFVPNPFPPTNVFVPGRDMVRLISEADRALGRLDGVTRLVPDIDFFIFMYVRKEAALSSQIEGTQATMADEIKAESKILTGLPKDVDDITHYINAMNFGLGKIKDLSLSLRLIRGVHDVLLTNARTEVEVTPGEFRTTQNWIGGTAPKNARYVPPPVHDMKRSLADLESFLHADDGMPVLVKASLAHAQFETIHPFLDGNGRTGRLLITFYLYKAGAIKKPVLYISEYFKKHRELYFELLNEYHNRGNVERWVEFFLEGVQVVADEAVLLSERITDLRDEDFSKVSGLGSRVAPNGMTLLRHLYKAPIVSAAKVEEVTGLSRPNANKLIERFKALGILEQVDPEKEYARSYVHREYLQLFS